MMIIDAMRVLDVSGEPGTVSPMHGHPDSVMHALTDATIITTSEDGATNRVEVPSGATFWTAESKHAVENVGDDAVHFIRIELK